MIKIRKYFSLSLLLPTFIFVLIAFGNNRSLAAVGDLPPQCDPYASSFESDFNIFKINIAGTTASLMNSLGQIIFQRLYGVTTTDAVKCEDIITGKLGGTGVTNLGFKGQDKCSVTLNAEEQALCDAMMGSTKVPYTKISYDGKANSLDIMAINSSLLGISNGLNYSIMHDPVAVNLAYFWNDQISRVPFFGKALAAAGGNTNLPIIQAGVEIWKIVRNIAIGFIAVILMYTGLLIVMRKKVNPQLVVTVQYAIPKIIVGLVLILFSYPIGAAITALSWGMYRGAWQIVSNAVFPGAVGSDVAAAAMSALAIAVLKMGFFAGVGLMIVILVALLSALMLLILLIKAVLIYIKMVFSTIIAPIEFAIGTVPGSEGRIGDWFKRMAKYGLTIFAMGVIIPVTLVMALKVLEYYGNTCIPGQACAIETAGLGTIMMVITPLVIIAVGYSMAFGMEKMVDKWIFGGKDSKYK